MNISESILYAEDSFYNQKCLFSISTQILYYYICKNNITTIFKK